MPDLGKESGTRILPKRFHCRTDTTSSAVVCRTDAEFEATDLRRPTFTLPSGRSPSVYLATALTGLDDRELSDQLLLSILKYYNLGQNELQFQ